MSLPLLLALALQTTPDGGDPAEPPAPLDEHAEEQAPGDAASTSAAASTTVKRKKPPRAPADFSLDVHDREGAPTAGASAADLLKLAPGVYLSQHAGQGKAPQIFLRGFDAEHGQDVEVTVGGLPINEASNVHGQGYADPTFLPPEVVRALRVKEGTYDPRQGDFAVAGSVHYDLGLADEGATLRLTGGSFGLLRGFVGVRPRGFDEGTFVAGELVRSDGFGPSRAFERGSAIAQLVQPLSVGGADLSVRALAGTSTGRFSSAGVLRLDDLVEKRVERFDTYEAGQGGAATRHLALVEATLKGDASKTTLSLYGTRRELSLRHNFTGALLFDEGDTAAQTSAGNTFGLTAEHDQRVRLLDAAQHFVVGVQARGDDVASTQDRLTGDGVVHTRQVDARIGLGHAALYGEAVLKLLPRTTLRAGARAEGVSFHIDDALADGGNAAPRDAFGFFVGPRLSADWRALPWLVVAGAYGEGFRTPQALALARGESAPATVVRSGEIGARATLADENDSDGDVVEPLGASLSAFVTHVEQDRVFDHATATSLFVGPTLRTGITGFVSSQPTPFLETTASATLVKAVLVEDGTDVPFAPPLVARVDSRLHGPLVDVAGTSVEGFLELGLSAVGARPLPFGDTARPIALVDGAAGLRAWSTTLSVECFNVLDAETFDGEFAYASRFTDDQSSVPARHVTVAAPRLLQLTLSTTF